jgi:hypothetical protein
MPRIFSYGSLQQPEAQRATFGRQLDGRRDALPAFTLATVQHGPKRLANVRRGAAADRVEGIAFDVTESELVTAEVYEEADAYTRIPAVLASGLEAWVYVDAATYQG